MKEEIKKYEEEVLETIAKYTKISNIDSQGRIYQKGYRELMSLEDFRNYGKLLIKYSQAIFNANCITKVPYLQKLIMQFRSLYAPIEKEQAPSIAIIDANLIGDLFHNLALCLTKLGHHYDEQTIEACKIAIYYDLQVFAYPPLINQHVNTCNKNVTAYTFKSCNEYLFPSLLNNQLNLSNPTTFNDPFDPPFFGWLSHKLHIKSLSCQALQQNLKVACFTSNTKLPSYTNKAKSILIQNDQKCRYSKDEYLNMLMWSHYGDFHRGVCIKYVLNDIPQHIMKSKQKSNKDVVCFFQDIEYSDEKLHFFTNSGTMQLKDALCTKSTSWKYENEVRLLYYDPENGDDHITVNIPNNCIEAVYFGLKCSEENKRAIQSILKDNKCKIYPTEELQPIQFFQMQEDENKFGEIKAIPF